MITRVHFLFSDIPSFELPLLQSNSEVNLGGSGTSDRRFREKSCTVGTRFDRTGFCKKTITNVNMDIDAPPPSGTNQRFLVGDKVEVRQTEAGMCGSWYTAVVVEVHKGQRMVEYDELLENEKEKKKLRELKSVGKVSDGDNLMATLPLVAPMEVTRSALRPLPPLHPFGAMTWTKGICVDCFEEDGWWEGVLKEDVTIVNIQDVCSLTRKSVVEIFYPDEAVTAKASVETMRIGQDWDEETGLWSLRGCVPVPMVPGVDTEVLDRVMPNPTVDPMVTDLALSDPLVNRAVPILVENSVLVPVVLPLVPVPEVSSVPFATVSSKKRSREHSSTKADEDESDNDDAKQQKNNVIVPMSSPKGKEPATIGLKSSQDETNSVTVHTLINDICLVNVGHSTGHGPGSSNVAAKMGDQEENDEPKIANSKLEAEMKNEDNALQDEEAAMMILKFCGWKISNNIRKKTWNCRSPKVDGVIKSFSSLTDALQFEACRGESPGGSNLGEAMNPSEGSIADKSEDVVKSDGTGGIGDDIDENDEYAVSARQILKRSGWEVFDSLLKGSSGESAWVYRTPPKAGTQKRPWFKNWRSAMDEYVRLENDSKQKKVRDRKSLPMIVKKGDGHEISLPVVQMKRSSPRFSSHESDKKTVTTSLVVQKKVVSHKKKNLCKDDDNKATPDGSGPSSIVKSMELPTWVLPIGNNEKGFSDLDDEDWREVDVAVDSTWKGTRVDLGQQFIHSINSTSVESMYHEKPFGTILSFKENDKSFVLQVVTHGFLKEQVKVIVDRGDMIIKARYGVDESFCKLSVRCNGSVSARVTLPKDVEYKQISAELKSPLLILTLPKAQPVLEDIVEIKIQ